MLQLIITAIWLAAPAYIPNTMAVLFKGKIPIDLGKNFIDGRRVLGDGKTFRGFFGGALCGLFFGIIQINVAGLLSLPDFSGKYLVIASLAFGSMLGDLFFSFFKRRLKLQRGSPAPVIDQLDFLTGALFLLWVLDPVFFASNFSPVIIIILLVITPAIHLTVNFIGFKLGKKEEPW